MKRAEQGGRTYPKEKEKESERRAPEGRIILKAKTEYFNRDTCSRSPDCEPVCQKLLEAGDRTPVPGCSHLKAPYGSTKGGFAGVGGNVDWGRVNGR